MPRHTRLDLPAFERGMNVGSTFNLDDHISKFNMPTTSLSLCSSAVLNVILSCILHLAV